MADLLVIVPSRARPEAVARLTRAWTDTGAYDDGAELLIAIDADDPAAEGYAIAAAGHRVRLDVSHAWAPMVHKLDRVADAYSRGGRYAALGFAGDDHVPQTAGWAGRYLDTLRDLGTGIVYGDDGYQGERLPTQWAMTADIVRKLGRMVPAPVEHLYCDNSVLDVGRAARCITYLPDVLIEHMHPVAGKAADDDQYRRVNGRAQYARDGSAYRRWRRTQLAQDAAAVRALRERTGTRA